MEVTINIIDRIYDQIKEMTQFNGITIEKYVLDCVLDKFNIMKYGDINEKFVSSVENASRTEEKNTPQKKKTIKTSKAMVKEDKEENNIKTTEEIKDAVKENEIKKEVLDITSQSQTEVTKRKRVLKTK